MTRVSENSTTGSLNFAISKAKQKLEDMHIKGASLKRIVKPSDDPVGNVSILSVRSENSDLKQFDRNIGIAKTQLEFTESSLEDLTDLLTKAKEIAIGQSSDTYNANVRQSVAQEVRQIYNEAISIANRRLGNRFVFAGHNTLTRPFDPQSNYTGDSGKIFIEIAKDYFIPINLPGNEVFFGANTVYQDNKVPKLPEPVDGKIILPENISPGDVKKADRSLASIEQNADQSNIFKELVTLENALMTNDPDLIQDLLPKLDDSINRVITLRTKVGAIINSIGNTEVSSQKIHILNEMKKSKIEDADVAELFSDIVKQQNILKATYRAGGSSLNQSLLNFLR
jgi:flagellar hook-associated protein 3 FlgL